jgi:integrase
MSQLTKAIIDRSLHKEKVYMVWDETIKGFGCKIHPTKKTFVYYFRSPVNKKFSYITIGVYGSITVDEARIQAKKFAHSVQIEKIDPREFKKVEIQQSATFEEFWQVFTEKYIKHHHKPSTVKRDGSRIKNYILPFFGKKLIANIERKDIIGFKDTMSHVKGNCTKCLRLLSVAFNQAELWEYIPANTNPCRGVPKTPDKMMERFLSIDELTRLEKTLEARETLALASPYTINAFRLIIYTGCRLGEVLSLKWEDVDLPNNCLRLKDSKTGKRTIPLNEHAIRIISNVQKQADNHYVFCGKKPGTHLVAVQKIWERIRKQAGISDVRIHDLRHSFASFMIMNGLNIFEVSKLLGHADIKTTMRYAHLTNQSLVEVTNKGGTIFNQSSQSL